MSKIIFKLDEIEDIKNRLGYIIQNGQKIDSNEFKKLIKQNQTALPKYLDEFEGQVFDYIRNSTGVSNQDIENAFRGIRSRNPVYKIVGNLKQYGLITESEDNTNAKRHKWVENKRSLIIRVENDLKNFRKSYLNLIKRANLESQNKKPSHMGPIVHSAFIDIDLTRILEQLIKGYSLKAIFEWPEEIKDTESLNRLYLMVFHILGEIFSDHVKYSNPWGIQDEHEKAKLIREGLQDRFGEPTIYRDLIRDFDKYNWNTEFDSVMSNLFTSLNMGWKWKDYRAMSIMRTKKHS